MLPVMRPSVLSRHCIFVCEAGIAQSVKWLAAGWKTGLQFSGRGGIFLTITTSRPSLGPPSLPSRRYWV